MLIFFAQFDKIWLNKKFLLWKVKCTFIFFYHTSHVAFHLKYFPYWQLIQSDHSYFYDGFSYFKIESLALEQQ